MPCYLHNLNRPSTQFKAKNTNKEKKYEILESNSIGKEHRATIQMQ